MGYGWRVCAKLLVLVEVDDERDSETPVRRLFGVVGAVRYSCHVLADELRAGSGGRRTMREPPLDVEAELGLGPVSTLLDRVRLLPGVAGVARAGPSPPGSASDGTDSSSSSASNDAGSRGSMLRRISAKLCISSLKRALEIMVVEKRACSYMAVKSAIVGEATKTPNSVR